MYLDDSSISCGVLQLGGIGNHPRQEEFERLYYYDEDDGWGDWHGGRKSKPSAAFIIASVTNKQKNAIKFLKKNGFQQSHRFRTNPNTGHKITIFTKPIKNKSGKRKARW